MPYTTQESREATDRTGNPETVGDLNFQLTQIMAAYLIKFGGKESCCFPCSCLREQIKSACLAYMAQRTLKYGLLNDVAGVLACCGREILRKRPRHWFAKLCCHALETVANEIYDEIAIPYEDEKCRLNGEIPLFELMPQ